MSMSTTTSFDDVSAAITVGIQAVSPELSVLCVFLLSYGISQHLGLVNRRSQAARKLNATDGPKKPSMEVASRSFAIAREMPQKRMEADASTKAAEAQMLAHLEQHEFTQALNLYRSSTRGDRGERQFSEHFYLTFLESAVRVGKIDVVERLLRAVKHSGMAPCQDFWRRVLKMMSSRKLFSTCLVVEALFRSLLPNDKVIWSCLVNAALEAGDAESAKSMLQKYQKADLSVKDHVLLFRTFMVLKDADAAEAVFLKLGAQASPLMLNLLLLTCVNNRQPERSLQLLEKAHELEDEARKLEDISGETVSVVDAISYNTVMKGFAHVGGLSDCFKCLRAMMERGVQPDDITFGTLLGVCIEENNVSAISDIISLSSEWQYQVGTVMYTHIIKGLVKANCLPKALELCEEMKRKAGARPDVITYSVLIKALVDQHDLKKALQLVADMRSAGNAPDDIILTHLLEGCRHAGDYETGKKLFDEFLAAGVKPSEFSLVTMLKLCGRVGAHHEALDLVAGWEAAHGLKPTVIHYTCLMSGCLRRKRYDLAWDAYELMKTNHVKPDGTTLSTLLPGMVAAQSWDKVLSLAKEAFVLPQRHKIPPEMLNSALAQMQGVGGYAEQVAELKELMCKMGITPTPRRLQPVRRQQLGDVGAASGSWRSCWSSPPPLA